MINLLLIYGVLLVHLSEISLVAVLIRFVLGGGAVAAAFILARRIGGRWGGIFAAFPAVFVAAIITIGTGAGPGQAVGLTLQVSKGAFVGMLANIACAMAAYFFIRRIGWKRGLLSAMTVWLVLILVFYGVALRAGIVR